MAQMLGIDIGGSGIKAALVDIDTGSLTSERRRVATPSPSTPDAVAAAVAELVRPFERTPRVGSTFPAVIHHGVALSAANVDHSWIGVDVAALLSRAVDADVSVLNDADAAGLAEMRIGAGRDEPGTVLVLTFGTGIGSALFVNGVLVPNTELGHLELRGSEAEKVAAEAVRERQGLSWSKWARRVQRYLRHLQMLLNPDLFILGGGASKRAEQWLPEIEIGTPIRIAQLLNNAGIVGAAMFAAGTSRNESRNSVTNGETLFRSQT
jgi:polyphosphate glucokinase